MGRGPDNDNNTVDDEDISGELMTTTLPDAGGGLQDDVRRFASSSERANPGSKQRSIRQTRRIFGNVSVRYPRHKSDHYMVMVCLHSAPLREYARYLGGRERLPLRPPTAPTREDGIFAALWRAVPNLLARDARKNAWILEATWRLVDERVSTR